MSFTRWIKGESDVYVIHHMDGTLTCYCEPTFKTESRRAMIAHLTEHRVKKDLVPQYAIDAIAEELEMFGDDVNDTGFSE